MLHHLLRQACWLAGHCYLIVNGKVQTGRVPVVATRTTTCMLHVCWLQGCDSCWNWSQVWRYPAQNAQDVCTLTAVSPPAGSWLPDNTIVLSRHGDINCSVAERACSLLLQALFSGALRESVHPWCLPFLESSLHYACFVRNPNVQELQTRSCVRSLRQQCPCRCWHIELLETS